MPKESIKENRDEARISLQRCGSEIQETVFRVARDVTGDAAKMHEYEVRSRRDKRGVDLISDALPFRPIWYRGPNAIRNAIDSAKFRSRSHRAVIRVYDDAGNVVETHEHKGDFKEAS